MHFLPVQSHTHLAHVLESVITIIMLLSSLSSLAFVYTQPFPVTYLSLEHML